MLIHWSPGFGTERMSVCVCVSPYLTRVCSMHTHRPWAAPCTDRKHSSSEEKRLCKDQQITRLVLYEHVSIRGQTVWRLLHFEDSFFALLNHISFLFAKLWSSKHPSFLFQIIKYLDFSLMPYLKCHLTLPVSLQWHYSQCFCSPLCQTVNIHPPLWTNHQDLLSSFLPLQIQAGSLCLLYLLLSCFSSPLPFKLFSSSSYWYW